MIIGAPIMVGGGGLRSSILITGLESTDTITCTGGGKSYSAAWNAASTQWEIVDLPLGTYTVTATRNSRTKTETVAIEVAGIYTVVMAFRVYLYKDGDECEAVTGGWTDSGYTKPSWFGTVQKQETCIYASKTLNGGGIGTANGIDLTNYAKLYVERKNTDETNLFQPWCGVLNAKNFSGNDIRVAVTAAAQAANVTETVFLDISNLSGLHYPCFCHSNYNQSGVGYLYKMWLE